MQQHAGSYEGLTLAGIMRSLRLRNKAKSTARLLPSAYPRL
jgi:hypothetical protein